MGAAYIYSLRTVNDESGEQWLLDKELQSPRGEYSYFGTSLSLRGSSLIVGATGNSPDAFDEPRGGERRDYLTILNC